MVDIVKGGGPANVINMKIWHIYSLLKIGTFEKKFNWLRSVKNLEDTKEYLCYFLLTLNNTVCGVITGLMGQAKSLSAQSENYLFSCKTNNIVFGSFMKLFVEHRRKVFFLQKEL